MRTFYVVLAHDFKYITVIIKTKGGKYFNEEKVKILAAKTDKFIDKDKLVIVNAIEFRTEEELEDFIE